MTENITCYTDDFLFFKHAVTHRIGRDAITPHVHNMFELVYFIGGDATSVVEDRRQKLRAGDLILVRPSKYHFIRFDSSADYERCTVLFDPKILGIEGAELLAGDREIICLRDHPRAADLFWKMSLYCSRLEPATFKRLAVSMLEELFCLLSLSVRDEEERFAASNPSLRVILKYINDNLSTLKDVSEVAEKCFVSQSYLFRLFQKELRQTPKKYINDKRLLMAQRLMSGGMRPTAVFEACGFSDYTTFYRNYVAFFGKPPSEK